MIFVEKLMMKSDELIAHLIASTQNHITRTEKFLSYEIHKLNKKTGNQWSVLECFEHLNLYFDFYLPEIDQKMQKSTAYPNEFFKPGLLGNYFAESMLPKENFRKMQTSKTKNPEGKSLDKKVLDQFIENLKFLIELMEKSGHKNLQKVTITTSFSPFVKIRLGDTFRFVVNHNERHLQQAERIL